MYESKNISYIIKTVKVIFVMKAKTVKVIHV